MKIVIAPDSFKESMSALEVSDAIESGFKHVFPEAEYIKVPMSDGGEGTVQSIVDATDGVIKKKKVTGPLGEPVEAFYGLSGDKSLAVIEMAASSGLDKVPINKRDPLKATTWGFGELIKDALEEGVEELFLGIGGSATNDGGVGMAMSLGAKILDSNNNPIKPTGEGLEDIAKIDLSELHPKLKDVKIGVACDVNNPLTGENGASHIYGPQKGATLDQIKYLDKNLEKLAECIKHDLDLDIDTMSGAGAAGGLGAGLVAFLDAELEEGGKLVVELLELEEKMSDANLVITGEGGLNHQTIFGKTPIAVSRVAKEKNIPTIALAGIISEGFEDVYKEGINAVFSIIPELTATEESLANGYTNLKMTAKNIASVIKLSK